MLNTSNGGIMMKRIGMVVLMLLMVLLCTTAHAGMIVGEDIPSGEITEFWYTYSSSSFPPYYLRYYLYTENGEKYLFHEAREGDDWPLGEEYNTVSGTVQLTAGEWDNLMDCLKGGDVSERSDEILDGDAGPWWYLNWSSHEGDLLEYRFADLGRQRAFEEQCSELAGNHVLSWLFWHRGGEMMPRSYTVFLRNGKYFLKENDNEATPLADEFAAQIRKIVTDYDLLSWDGFDESMQYVLDGEDFSLEVRYADGTAARAYGSNAFPDGYHEVMARLDDVLQQEKMTRIAGTYCLENSELTLTLQADGTYAFSGSQSGQEPDSGTWYTYLDMIDLSEDAEEGLEFSFGYDADALIYLDMGEDSFPYADLTNGARFVRVDKKEAGMRLWIGETEVPVTWERNASVEELSRLLPLSIQMSMYGGFEQVGPIGQSILRDDRQTDTGYGDIVLYQGNQVVVFYGSNTWAYTRLGHINLSEEEMTDLLSHGNVILTIRNAEEST